MTRLLASVTDAAEAEQAIRGGADLIDLKDPGQGALGALALWRISAIVSQVAGRRLVSATIGDLPPDAGPTADLIRATAAAGVDFVKVGLFSDRHVAACLQVIADLALVERTTVSYSSPESVIPAGCRNLAPGMVSPRPAPSHRNERNGPPDSTPGCAIIAVLFADRAPDLADLGPYAAAGCAGVMLDTADKTGGRLLDHLEPDRLSAFVVRARSLGLLCGLAGSLRLGDIPGLLQLAPDYLGFRGALCLEGQRRQTLDRDRLYALSQAMHRGHWT